VLPAYLEVSVLHTAVGMVRHFSQTSVDSGLPADEAGGPLPFGDYVLVGFQCLPLLSVCCLHMRAGVQY
jgi:hypothetical protein